MSEVSAFDMCNQTSFMDRRKSVKLSPKTLQQQQLPRFKLAKSKPKSQLSRHPAPNCYGCTEKRLTKDEVYSRMTNAIISLDNKAKRRTQEASRRSLIKVNSDMVSNKTLTASEEVASPVNSSQLSLSLSEEEEK